MRWAQSQAASTAHRASHHSMRWLRTSSTVVIEGTSRGPPRVRAYMRPWSVAPASFGDVTGLMLLSGGRFRCPYVRGLTLVLPLMLGGRDSLLVFLNYLVFRFYTRYT